MCLTSERPRDVTIRLLEFVADPDGRLTKADKWPRSKYCKHIQSRFEEMMYDSVRLIWAFKTYRGLFVLDNERCNLHVAMRTQHQYKVRSDRLFASRYMYSCTYMNYNIAIRNPCTYTTMTWWTVTTSSHSIVHGGASYRPPEQSNALVHLRTDNPRLKA